MIKSTCPRCKLDMEMPETYRDMECPPCRLESRLLRDVPRGSSVLDIGSGLGRYHPALGRHAKELTLLDAHAPYFWSHINPVAHSARGAEPRIIVSRAETFLPLLKADAFDVALALDVPEHLNALDAWSLIGEMKRIAKKVILFVPEGEHPQDKDGYGMGGDHWQTHRSTWNTTATNMLTARSGRPKHGDQFVSWPAGEFEIESLPDFHAANPGVSAGALYCVCYPKLPPPVSMR